MTPISAISLLVGAQMKKGYEVAKSRPKEEVIERRKGIAEEFGADFEC